MAGVMKLACLVLACMIVAGPFTAYATFTCDMFDDDNLALCAEYLMNIGPMSPECCDGVRNVNNLIVTTADRQQACACMKTAVATLVPIELDRLAEIPTACGVTLPFKISTTTNCTIVR